MKNQHYLQQKLRRKLDQYQLSGEKVLAALGDADGNLLVSSDNLYLMYARLGDGTLLKVYNYRTEGNWNESVWVGPSEYDPHHLYVLNTQSVFATPVNQGVPAHHHEFGFRMTTWVWAQQFMPWLVRPKDRYTITVYKNNLYIDDAYVLGATEDINLSGRTPVDGARFVLVQLEEDGLTLSLKNGDIELGTDLPEIPVPDDGCIPIAAVRLYEGQVKIEYATNKTDVLDLRSFGIASANAITNLGGSVRMVLLSGLSVATSRAIEATDNIIQAFGFLQSQINEHLADTDNPHEVTKDQVGLSDVDNTSDADKPVSTAQAAADAAVLAAAETYADSVVGESGNTILNGTTTPDDSLGVDGDFYIDTVAMLIYGPKASGAWDAGVSLVGPAGEDGVDGATWTAGTSAPSGGNDGDFYFRTTTNDVYENMSGTWTIIANLTGTGGGGGGGRTLIEEITPTGVGTISFASIPDTYQKLYIEFVLKSTASADGVTGQIQFNGDTTDANYSFMGTRTNQFGLNVDGGSSRQFAGTNTLNASNVGSNEFSHGTIEILQYANTSFYKTAFIFWSNMVSPTYRQSIRIDVNWLNTAAIDQIELIISAGNYASGSVFRLYGED